MILVFTKFPIHKEHLAAFRERAVESFGQKGVRSQKGFVNMKLLSPEKYPNMPENNTFIIETLWQDMASFKAYTKSDAYKRAHEDGPPREWFAGHPSVEIYELAKKLKAE